MYEDHYFANKKIIVVEDDADLARLIKDFLTKHQFSVEVIHNGGEAPARIIGKQPDLVILDVMLPGLSGMDICQRIRNEYQGLIMMLTALDDDIDQMMGLELGADDYVIKHVQPRLLLSRIKALFRRANTMTNDSVSPSFINPHQSLLIGCLAIDTQNRRVTLNKHPVKLTSADYDLLHLLALNAGEVVSRNTIVETIRGFSYDGLDRSIDRRISRLRKKLNDDPDNPQLIKTVRSKGYQLCPDLR